MADHFQSLAAGAEPHALRGGLWARRAVMTALAAVAILALAGVLGQEARTSSATGDAVSVQLRAPETLRGGLLFGSRIVLTAHRDVEHLRLVLDRGWIEGMQVNSITPDPQSESVSGDRTELSFDALDAGRTMTVWLQFQVDPTLVGRRPYGLEVADGQTPLLRLHRTITVLP
jgi:hypothetical protein